MQKQAECSREANGQATGQTTVQEVKHNTMTKEVKDKDRDIERIFMEVPFTGKSTRKFIQDVKGIARDLKPTAKIIAVSKPPKAVRHFFQNKDPISKDLQSNIVYKLSCSSCPATYIGETTRQMFRRLKEHGAMQPSKPTPEDGVRRSARIAAKTKNGSCNSVALCSSSNDRNGDNTVSTDNNSAVARHAQETGHNIDWTNWIILSKDRHPYRLCVREALAIAEFQPSLNVTVRSVPLFVFPEGYSSRRKGIERELKHNKKIQ
ncbi:unnamed protein product [Rotaria magnacalcarata]|uniref:Uncharacterized protein n=1 Tax=Rotaria magnacalcarata TaxID=392030 RepID=A0A816ZGV6_9BILA|nr:unnamed protein product [Rotaria magnacalcarata]CAF3831988.1 unnamed protein product [Rotaria magnacalcarata]